MKKKLTLFLVAFVAITAFAVQTARRAAGTEVTIDFTAQGYENGAEVPTLTQESVTVTFDKGTNSNAPKYYTSGTAVRAYGGNTLTVSSAESIAKVEFTFGANDGTNEITADNGTLADGVWTGASNSVTFTIGGTTGNRRIQKLVVTLGEAPTVSAPTITGETQFVGKTTVTLACATEDAEIHYTVDGTEPTAESTKYAEPFEITATTTVQTRVRWWRRPSQS